MEMRFRKRRSDCLGGIELSGRKKRRSSRSKSDHFEDLPDDLVLCILGKLSSAAESPADFISALLVNKRINGLGVQPCVLSKASPRIFAVKAKNWCEGAEKFLKQCVDVGNIEASYTLGMIRFYCLQQRENGASLMAKAAISAHAQALYSLAVIQFNGSGGSKNNKDLRAGVSLCARAAFLGHIDAIRELGHCLQDGYGVRRNIAEGRKYLVQANARELASVLATASKSADSFSQCPLLNWHPNHRNVPGSGCPLLSDFGCNVPAPEPHPASQFLTDWFALLGGVPAEGLRLCSHDGCGRPETRRHEFRRCSVCGTVTYCSRACQALDWKLRHKVECVPMERVEEDDAAADNGNHNNDIAIAGIQE